MSYIVPWELPMADLLPSVAITLTIALSPYIGNKWAITELVAKKLSDLTTLALCTA
jgi:hypothetical protein